VNWQVVCVAVMQMRSVCREDGPLMIGVTLFRNCFESTMIRSHLRLRVQNAFLRKKQNASVLLFLKEILIPTKRKQFHGRRDLRKQLNQMMSNLHLVDCWVEHLVNNRKKKNKSDAVFV
jgi:hypothetical protein